MLPLHWQVYSREKDSTDTILNSEEMSDVK